MKVLFFSGTLFSARACFHASVSFFSSGFCLQCQFLFLMSILKVTVEAPYCSSFRPPATLVRSGTVVVYTCDHITEDTS